MSTFHQGERARRPMTVEEAERALEAERDARARPADSPSKRGEERQEAEFARGEAPPEEDLFVGEHWAAGCEVCGTKNASVRLSVFFWVFSAIIFSRRNASVGTWCSRHRRNEAAKNTAIALLFGPWGIPFGLFWTLQAFFTNIAGGRQPRDANAALLRAMGVQLLEAGEYSEAAEALASSLRLEEDEATAQLLGAVLYERPETVSRANRAKGRLWAISPLFVLAAALAIAPAAAVGVYFVSAVMSSASGEGERVLDRSLTELRPGDCIRSPGSGEVEKVSVVSCSDPTAVKVLNTFQITGYDAYPGEDAIDMMTASRCSLEATSYMAPTRESWEGARDRLVVCLTD